jgi:hypothetical protein
MQRARDMKNPAGRAGIKVQVLLPAAISRLSADESGGGSVDIKFTRVIVWPDGRREVEGTTPKAAPRRRWLRLRSVALSWAAIGLVRR